MEKVMKEGLTPENLDKFGEEEIASTEDTVTVASVNAELTAGEDLLLAEIDAFRSKAAQLQQLINAKESKAAELEELVSQMEAANRELQEELAKKQEAADSLVKDVETQVDRMMQRVKQDMDNLEGQIAEQVNRNNETYQAKAQSLQDTLSSVSDGLGTIKNELSEKTHTESVQLYRLIKDSIKEADNRAEIIAKTEAQYKSVKTFCTVITITSVLCLCTSIAVLLHAFGVI